MAEHIKIGDTEFHIASCKVMKKSEFIRWFKGIASCDLGEAWEQIKKLKVSAKRPSAN